VYEEVRISTTGTIFFLEQGILEVSDGFSLKPSGLTSDQRYRGICCISMQES
jgi:hypothetical protein